MAKSNIRVPMPTGSADGMILLGESITAQHETFTPPSAGTGAAAPPAEISPLHHFDMAAFRRQTADAKDILSQSRQKETDAVIAVEEAHLILGMNEGQTMRTKGTLLFEVGRIRDILAQQNIHHPELTQRWGFNVVLSEPGGKENIRIDIPRSSPAQFIELCRAITRQHESMGESSPLHHLDMAAFKERTETAARKLQEGKKLHDSAQKLMQKSKLIIGIWKEQTAKTEGTLYFLMNRMKKTLLAFYRGSEEELQEWGFTVVITETVPGRKTKRIEVIIPKGASAVVKNVINGSSATNSGKAPLALWEGEGPIPGNPIEIDKGNSWVVIAPSGILSIKNLSDKKTGRCKLTVSK